MLSSEIRDSTVGASHWRVQSLLGIRPATKPKVYLQIFNAAKMNSLSYWLEIFFAAGIATFGLVENSPAVIIGAMLISPLMGPIMGTGLALAVGDLYLGIKAIVHLVVSVAVSIAFSGFLVWLLPFHSATSEILARTNPNLLDLGIALLSGLAGSVVVSRGSGDGVTALPGVAIAVALMPPLCTVGFGFGSGVDLEIMGGAGLLFLTNLVAIVASAFLVFLLVGLNAPEIQEVALASRKDERLAQFLASGPVSGMMKIEGRLRWRVLTLLVLLGALSVPLHKAFSQVTQEILNRAAVRDVVKQLAPPNTLVSQQVNIGRDTIIIRLISTQPIASAKIAKARTELSRRTGEDVQLSVDAVASKQELADLMAHLSQPAPIIPKQESLAEIQTDLLDRVRPVLQSIWPSVDAPLHDFDVAFNDVAGISVQVRYEAEHDLGEIPIKMVLQQLQSQLVAPNLTLHVDRIRPAKPTRLPAKVTKPGRP